jgi:hypothetical protein
MYPEQERELWAVRTFTTGSANLFFIFAKKIIFFYFSYQLFQYIYIKLRASPTNTLNGT